MPSLFASTAEQAKLLGTVDLGLAGVVPGVTPQIAVAYWNLFPDTYSGPCLQIERVSDNAVQDIGFDANGHIDIAAIATFCGASNGRITTWYNQSPYTTGSPFVAFGQVANRGVIYNGSTGLMVRNANGHIAWDQAGIEGKMWNHTTASGPFIVMLCFDTTDTFFVTTGADNNSHYLGLGNSGSSSNFVANDGGSTPDATTTYFKNGVATPVANRGDYYNKFADGNIHRWVGRVPTYTPTNPTGIGIYDDGTGSISMNNGKFAGYALLYRDNLTDTEIASIDTYLASNLI